MLTSEQPRTVATEQQGDPWRTSLWIALGGALVSVLAPMVLAAAFEPFLAILAAPFLLAALTAKWPRVFAVVVGLVCVLQLLGALPTLIDTLQHPESIRDFVPLLLFGLSAIVGATAAVPAFRNNTNERAPRAIVAGCAAVFLLGVIVSAVAAAGLPDASLQPGDATVAARDTEFDTAAVEVGTGGALFVTNDDATRHTFTIDELGVDVELPAKRSTRFRIDEAPGTYRFYRRPHPDMTGTLTIR